MSESLSMISVKVPLKKMSEAIDERFFKTAPKPPSPSASVKIRGEGRSETSLLKKFLKNVMEFL